MKKSEAVNVIGKVLVFGKEGLTNALQEKYKDLNLSQIILEELIREGMLPSMNKEKEIELWDDINKHNSANPCLYGDCMDYYFDWELDDE